MNNDFDDQIINIITSRVFRNVIDKNFQSLLIHIDTRGISLLQYDYKNK